MNPLKTGDIMHMRKQCVPGLSSERRGLGMRLVQYYTCYATSFEANDLMRNYC